MNSVHPNLKLLSHSSKETKRACPRKFQLYRMMQQSDMRRGDGDYHTDFGKFVGYGCQLIFAGYSIEQTMFSMFLEWQVDIDDSDGEAQKKTFWHALHAVAKFEAFRVLELRDYELVFYDEKPAVELSYRIDCGDGFYDRGKLDALLKNRNGNYAVFEAKTTGARKVHEAMYKNSDQGVGYSVVVDAIANAAGELNERPYEVLYCVYQSFNMEWQLFSFLKSFTERALWIKDLLLDIKQISDYAEADYFPRYGGSCYDYFRPCEYFEICNMSDRVLIGDESKIEVIEDRSGPYQFEFTLDELIEAQLKKQGV